MNDPHKPETWTWWYSLWMSIMMGYTPNTQIDPDAPLPSSSTGKVIKGIWIIAIVVLGLWALSIITKLVRG